MRHLDRILIGLLLIFGAFFVLWYGSPWRQPLASPDSVYPAAFTVLFALGFVIAGVGVLGYENDYPAFLGTLVLYFLIGGLIAVVLFVRREGVGAYNLADMDNPGFWRDYVRLAAMWPFELLVMVEFLGYRVS